MSVILSEKIKSDFGYDSFSHCFEGSVCSPFKNLWCKLLSLLTYCYFCVASRQECLRNKCLLLHFHYYINEYNWINSTWCKTEPYWITFSWTPIERERFIDRHASNFNVICHKDSLRSSYILFPNDLPQQPGSLPRHYAACVTVSTAETCLTLQMCKNWKKLFQVHVEFCNRTDMTCSGGNVWRGFKAFSFVHGCFLFLILWSNIRS